MEKKLANDHSVRIGQEMYVSNVCGTRSAALRLLVVGRALARVLLDSKTLNISDRNDQVVILMYVQSGLARISGSGVNN